MTKLWFDVGIKRYTTVDVRTPPREKLWFDVVIKKNPPPCLL